MEKASDVYLKLGGATLIGVGTHHLKYIYKLDFRTIKGEFITLVGKMEPEPTRRKK